MASNTGPKIATDGLILALDAANYKSYPRSGSTWTDLSGNGYDGTLLNGPTFESGNNGSFAFDGTDECALTSLREGVGFCDSISSNEFTVITWFKPSGNNGVICGLAGGIGSTSTFAQYMSGTTLNTVVKGADNTIKTGLSTSEYHMVTYTWDGTTGQGYYNNETPNSLSIGTAAFQSYNFGIADPRNGTLGNYARFSGNIPICLVYVKALSTAEVNQNYNATKARFGL